MQDRLAAAQQVHDVTHRGVRLDLVLAGLHVTLKAIGLNAIFEHAAVGDDAAAFEAIGDFDDAAAVLDDIIGGDFRRAGFVEGNFAEIDRSSGCNHQKNHERQHEIGEDNDLAARTARAAPGCGRRRARFGAQGLGCRLRDNRIALRRAGGG